MSEQELKKFELDAEIKGELLKLAENVSKEAVESIFKIAEIAIKKSATKYDDMILPALPLIKEKIDEVLDKIHEEG